MQPATADKRRNRSLWWGRALPWLVAGSIAVATIAVFLINRNSVDAERARAIASAEELFSNVVADTESRVALEQSKLLFLAKGATAWASSSEASSTADLASYMSDLPVSDRVPALRWAALVELDSGTAVVTAASSGTGEPLPSMEGLDLASDPRIASAASEAMQGRECSIAVYGSSGEEQVVVLASVAREPGRLFALGFVGPVFLSPALAHEGVHSALVPPGGEFVVVRRDGTVPDLAAFPEGPEGPEGQVELSSDESTYRYSATQDVFGSPWRLVVSSGDNFLEIPRSREPLAILFGGMALAFAVLGLLLTRQRAAERQDSAAGELSRSNRRYLTGFDRAPIGSAELDVEGRVIRSNRTMATQLGLTADDLPGRVLFDFVHPADAGDQAERFRGLVDGAENSWQAEVRYRRSDGQIAWITESVSALGRSDDVDRRFLVQSFDTTARRVAELELEHLAFTDSLTGLPNRTRLVEYLDQVLLHSADARECVALLFIDIDRFKVVNDSLGHFAGDQVIANVGRRLAEIIDAPHFVARFGGDEFVVVCRGLLEEAELDEFTRNVLDQIRQPVLVDGELIHVTASIGLSTDSGGSSTAESMLRDADAAMYRAKAAGRDTSERFDITMRTAAVRRLDLERSLRLAIERDEFTIHYQPVVDLVSNQVAGFEALLRWEHPELGLLQPREFIEVANETGLMDQIDELTLQRACAQLTEWSRTSEAARSWHLAVNCSPRWFRDARLRELIPSVLGDSSLEANRLWLEVTEDDLLSDSDAALATFRDLHELGVNVAIDDFGTGFSSLSYLSQFHVDRLKIDQSFVQSLDRSDADEAIVAAVVDMAAALGIATVAEGAESVAQLDALKRLGADYAQGYLLSRPLSASEVERELASPA